MNIITKLLARFRERSDKKFRERIDRVYFHHDGDGNRFFKGQLHAIFDEKTNMPGGLSSSGVCSLEDIRRQLSSIQPRFVGWEEYHYRKDGQSNLEGDENTCQNPKSDFYESRILSAEGKSCSK